jgi:hypothetical protein
MTTTHTPGPWRAMHDGAIQRDAPLPMGGAVVAYTRHADLATQAANARLIAAAPVMLAALKLAEQNATDRTALAAIRAAIANAEGTAS